MRQVLDALIFVLLGAALGCLLCHFVAEVPLQNLSARVKKLEKSNKDLWTTVAPEPITRPGPPLPKLPPGPPLPPDEPQVLPLPKETRKGVYPMPKTIGVIGADGIFRPDPDYKREIPAKYKSMMKEK